MNCLNKNCKITSDTELMITCWLCHQLCHYKCTGYSTLVNEAASKQEGIAYFCVLCRKPAVEYFRFFHGTKNRFMDIQKSATTLSENISNYGKLFEEFATLNNLKSPPQITPKRRKSARKGAKDKDNVSSVRSPTALNPNAIVHNTPSITASSDDIEVFPTENQNSTELMPRFTNAKSSNFGATASEILNNQPSTSQKSTLNSVNNKIANSTAAIAKQLIVIPPKKSIFVSRLAFETTPEDINQYILNKINAVNADIFTKKFNYTQPRDITSFRITVSPDLFDKIIDPYFWPENTLVREYVFRNNLRPNNIARLPTNNDNHSKN